MSQDTSSEHEAMIAAQRLHALLSKHNITLSDIEERGDLVEDERFETVNFPYRRMIARAIAELYYCHMYYACDRKNYAWIVLTGRDQNRVVAISIINRIYRIVDQEAKAASTRELGRYTSTYASSFRTAAAQRIRSRCWQLIKEARAGTLLDEDTGKNLPALASLYDREKALTAEFLENSGVKLDSIVARPRAYDANAAALGTALGDRVPLHQGLAKTAPKALEHKD